MDSQLVVSLKRRKNFYGSRVKVLAPAKINLYFNVLGTYPSGKPFSGYHRIESIIERISLCDWITITIAQNPRIEIRSNIKSLETTANLCVRAAALMKKKYKIPYGFQIYLHKRIPMGSGLGGGSSDAASTMLALCALLKPACPSKALYELGSQVGSDVNFFLAQTPFALVRGRGEIVFPFEAPPLHHCIIWPGAHVSTKEVYGNTRVKLTKFIPNVNIMIQALKTADRQLVCANSFNALEVSALSLSGKLRFAKNYFDSRGIFCRMTGSGSALFTFAPRYRLPGIARVAAARKWVVANVRSF
ncbi:MAG: 4-(cytidine 5'-diphospho)-2-C-methyl-D-erythritol kinase [Candidatus Omnitrophica bacterium]|nr:4-(cytidine 5'-diphospho)-2-C-methyl-D-erythritol kinase [Candidatus Omnitrophota bacterium]